MIYYYYYYLRLPCPLIIAKLDLNRAMLARTSHLKALEFA